MGTYIGIDVGTSSLKAVRIRVNGGLASVDEECTIAYAEGNNPTRRPDRWAECAETALTELWREDVEGIGFTGQMHGLVVIDDQGNVIGPTLLWLDMEGENDLRSFQRRFSIDFVSRTSNIALPDFTLAKWLYASGAAPEILNATAMLMPVKDYVRWRLFGHTENVTDRSEAVGMQMFNPFTGSWDWDIIKSARIPPHAVSTIRPANAVVDIGTPSQAVWAKAQVVVGAGDQATAARAVGANKEGVVSVSLGTSGVVSVPWKVPDLPSGWDGALHLLPGTSEEVFDVIATIPAFGPGLQWAAQFLGGDLKNLDRLASSLWSGSSANPSDGDILFIPYLNGSGAPHPNIHTRAAISGLSLASGPEDVARAVYDGFAMEIATLIDEIRAWGAPVREIVVSGGASRLDHFTETLVSYLDVPCNRVDETSASAVGAALLAWDAQNPGSDAILSMVPINRRGRRGVSERWLKKRNEVLAEPQRD